MGFHPQTPQSPSQPSPCTTDPSTSMNTSMTSISSTLPTPAHSVNGSGMPSEMVHDNSLTDDSPNKRKRSADDVAGRDQKKAHLEDRRLGIENLHLDVGEKYLLCRTPVVAPAVPLSEDLFEMLGLTDIAADVARFLPNGEKNAIRKTYKGYIKKLGVSGAFDSVKADPTGPDSLVQMVLFPEEEWGIHFVKGREIEAGYSGETRAKMPKALSMAKGTVPKNVWDSSVLGEWGPSGAGKTAAQAQVPVQPAPTKPTAPNTPNLAAAAAATAGGASNVRPKTQPPIAQDPARDPARPKRSIKKRGYGDSSFEGYDGYMDDGMETGYSTGEGDGGPKRRKKNHPVGPQAQSPFPPVRQQSYGPGMVGA